MSKVPTLTFNNGVTTPQLGFGVFQVPPSEVIEPVEAALAAGYRLIDTAAAYENEEGVGKAIANSGIPRDELFITTKLWNADQGRDKALRAFDRSMSKLGLDVLDLYLIHWPLPKRNLYVETWKTLEEIYATGAVRAIGVSNFTVHHLNRLRDETGITPAVNQIELHPRLPQDELRALHADRGIITEAWSPLGQGQGLLDDPVLHKIGKSVGKTAAQVVLRWHIQLGNMVIPKSVHADRIKANFDVFDFELAPADMGEISAMNAGERVGPDPDTFDVV